MSKQADPGMFAVQSNEDPMVLTQDDALWLQQSGRLMRIVFVTTDRKHHVRGQGMGAPKSATVLGRYRNGHPIS